MICTQPRHAGLKTPLQENVSCPHPFGSNSIVSRQKFRLSSRSLVSSRMQLKCCSKVLCSVCNLTGSLLIFTENLDINIHRVYVYSLILLIPPKQSPIESLDLHDHLCDKFWLLFAQSQSMILTLCLVLGEPIHWALHTSAACQQPAELNYVEAGEKLLTHQYQPAQHQTGAAAHYWPAMSLQQCTVMGNYEWKTRLVQCFMCVGFQCFLVYCLRLFVT